MKAKMNTPTARPVAAYVRNLATVAVASVAVPASVSSRSSETLAAGAIPASPTLKTNPPETGWESAEITR